MKDHEMNNAERYGVWYLMLWTHDAESRIFVTDSPYANDTILGIGTFNEMEALLKVHMNMRAGQNQ